MGLDRYVIWYYTPMAQGYATELDPIAVVYDCMDQLAAFMGAPAELPRLELDLLRKADLVFTGGRSLHAAKRHMHPRVYMFPSAVDFAHFASARNPLPDPVEQAALPRPRAGFFGVIDERMDLDLLDGVAALRPHLQLVMIGPVVKIAPEVLPHRPNIHWLGSRKYEVLPHYIRGWDVAILPFARNASTQFISPTKTPEYLASGKPVVSTSVRDVVYPYGAQEIVRIADTPDAFCRAVDAAVAEDGARRMAAADRLIRRMTWDRTWAEMQQRITDIIGERDVTTSASALRPTAAADLGLAQVSTS